MTEACLITFNHWCRLHMAVEMLLNENLVNNSIMTQLGLSLSSNFYKITLMYSTSLEHDLDRRIDLKNRNTN